MRHIVCNMFLENMVLVLFFLGSWNKIWLGDSNFLTAACFIESLVLTDVWGLEWLNHRSLSCGMVTSVKAPAYLLSFGCRWSKIRSTQSHSVNLYKNEESIQNLLSFGETTFLCRCVVEMFMINVSRVWHITSVDFLLVFIVFMWNNHELLGFLKKPSKIPYSSDL